MNNWFKCKVKYRKEDDKGVLKNITEVYLVDAVSFIEAETRIHKELGSVIRGGFDVVGITKSNIVDVFENDVDYFHEVKVSYTMIDQEAKTEKKVSNTHLIGARSVKDAIAKIEEELAMMMVPYDITSVKVSPVLEVFRFESKL